MTVRYLSLSFIMYDLIHLWTIMFNTSIFYSTVCKNGYYGQNCSSVCSPNCKNCKPTDGTCSCYAGWMEPNCSTGNFETSQYIFLSFKMNMLQNMACQFYISKNITLL